MIHKFKIEDVQIEANRTYVAGLVTRNSGLLYECVIDRVSMRSQSNYNYFCTFNDVERKYVYCKYNSVTTQQLLNNFGI